jgi:hypothetical protein
MREMQNDYLRRDLLEEHRWAEIRFYYFCIGLYLRRHDLLDVTNAIEAFCNLEDIPQISLRNLAVKVVTDYTYVPNENEVIYLARKHGYSLTDMAKWTGTSRRNICYKIKNLENFTVYLRHTEPEREQIIQLLEIMDYLKEQIK